jgi:outer membrane protein assembly factor BamD (BamD/ComL family)
MTKTVFTWFILSTTWVVVAVNWGKADWSATKKIAQTWGYEKASLQLASENRALQAKVLNLEHKVAKLETENSTLVAITKSSKSATRSIASVPQADSSDLVQYEIYQWTPEKLLAIAEKELHFKNYERSSQYYNELIQRFPNHKIVTDKTLFGGGIAAYEAKKHKHAIKHFNQLVTKHPRSEFFRGAKLWMAMSEYNSGNHRKFASTVEEFRVKYRNTEEWKILSKYYEDINYKYKK